MRRLIRKVFPVALEASAWLAQFPVLGEATAPVMVVLARLTGLIQGGVRRGDDAGALAEEWRRLMPSRGMTALNAVDAASETAYGEILLPCPLRGTGDLRACYRLMAYDRELLRQAGGHLVVVRSQAEPGVATCQVAIRPARLPTGDLVPAHERGPLPGVAPA